jgi:SpoVK/Ycf46/Vps4 family AAA+-type ATPase
MQDRKSPVFVVATANDVSNLPPELLRKGRFDEIFFVDLPNLIERKKIFEIHIQKRQRNISNFNIEELSKLSEYFTGAEIESAIESAMYDAFSDNKREIQTSDIMASLKSSVPLAKLMENDIQYLREWAKNRARNASTLPIEFLLKSDEEDL